MSDKTKESAKTPAPVLDPLTITFSDINKEICSDKVMDTTFIATAKQGTNEVWFSFSLAKRKMIFKIPKQNSSGRPHEFEFTVSQFIKLLSSSNRKKLDDEEKLREQIEKS